MPKVDSKLDVCLVLITILCCVCVLVATPVSIVYAVYCWASVDMVFKYALWEGVVLWLKMMSAIIPVGLISAKFNFFN